MAAIEMDNPNSSRSEDENTDKSEIREVIVIRVGADVSPSDAARVCRQVTRVMAQLISNVLGEVSRKGSPGASHPGTQQMFSALANAEAASLTFDPPRVAHPGMMPGGPGSGRGGPIGRA